MEDFRCPSGFPVLSDVFRRQHHIVHPHACTPSYAGGDGGASVGRRWVISHFFSFLIPPSIGCSFWGFFFFFLVVVGGDGGGGVFSEGQLHVVKNAVGVRTYPSQERTKKTSMMNAFSATFVRNEKEKRDEQEPSCLREKPFWCTVPQRWEEGSCRMCAAGAAETCVAPGDAWQDLFFAKTTTTTTRNERPAAWQHLSGVFLLLSLFFYAEAFFVGLRCASPRHAFASDGKQRTLPVTQKKEKEKKYSKDSVCEESA